MTALVSATAARAVALADCAEVLSVPTDDRRRARRCLHARHRWLVTRCRPAGGAR